MEADSFATLVKLAAKFTLEPAGIVLDGEDDALVVSDRA
jgi:hypothetical protein